MLRVHAKQPQSDTADWNAVLYDCKQLALLHNEVHSTLVEMSISVTSRELRERATSLQ
jgi:hypothetical protein